ncbi:MAG: hypothetical protein AAGK17_02390 [Pseudomonadota bacterium]
MRTLSKTAFIAAASALIATPVLAQEKEGKGGGECRQEVQTLCGARGETDRKTFRTCVRDSMDQLSEGCVTKTKERMKARGGKKKAKEEAGSAES